MFVGHFALAFGAKKYTPQVSLGVLFLAWIRPQQIRQLALGCAFCRAVHGIEPNGNENRLDHCWARGQPLDTGRCYSST